MAKVSEVIDGLLLATGSGYALANIQNALGIAILVIQLAWITTKFVIKLVHKIKSKETDVTDLDEDVSNVIGSLEEISANLSEMEKKEDVNNKQP